MTERSEYYHFYNGEKAALPFSDAEYEARLRSLRAAMHQHGVSAALLTSIQAIAYYSGFLYCAFGALSWTSFFERTLGRFCSSSN